MKKSTKLDTLNEFPAEFNLDDFLQRLIVIEKIEEGLAEAKAGKTIPHEKVKKWLLSCTNNVDKKIVERFKSN